MQRYISFGQHMPQWLLNRLFAAKKDQPKPRFAFQGTVNWMRALSILVQNGDFERSSLKAHYSGVQRRKPNYDADTIVFENTMMAYGNHVALERLLADVKHPYDTCRAAIIAWYYSTYFTCSAMVAAASGSAQEAHAKTARVWHRDIVDKDLVVGPFSLSLSSLVEKTAKAEVNRYRGGNDFDLKSTPSNEEEAFGAAISYLMGTCLFERWKVEEKLVSLPEFKSLGVSDFRTKKARELRDAHLARSTVNFLVQAFRYRGKANYRDSIFLGYGYDNSKRIQTLIEDLCMVSIAFQRMASHYLARRVEKGAWSEFVSDLQENTQLSVGPQYLEPEI